MIKVNSSEIKKYVERCKADKKFQLHDSTLNKLFSLYPKNNNLNEVLMKVCCLNVFQSTSIIKIEEIAKYIVSLDIDKRLQGKDLTIVNEIADKNRNGINRSVYSFASKYCSHHFENDFPIYDSYVEKMLKELNKQDNFSKFKTADLKDYIEFNRVLNDFRNYYNLNDFTLKELDMYLWSAGKEFFTKKY